MKPPFIRKAKKVISGAGHFQRKDNIRLGASYFGSRHLKHLKKDMQEMVESGCNFVVHTMSEEDMTYYADTMTEVVKVSKEVGLEVFLDPWGVGRAFGGEAFSNFISQNPQCRQRLSLAEGELFADKACLNSTSFRRLMEGWIELAASTGASGVFWDEPHLYYGELIPLFGKKQEVWACACHTCQWLFKERFGHDMPRDFTEEVMQFRQATILRFIQSLSQEAAKKGLKNALCLFPLHDPRYGVYRWEEALKDKNLDIFGTDPYWLCFNRAVEDFVREVSREVVALCNKYGKEPQIWIQGFRIPTGREEEVGQAIRTAYGEGVRNLAVWSFQGAYYMSHLRCDRPEVVWKRVTEGYKELRARCHECQP